MRRNLIKFKPASTHHVSPFGTEFNSIQSAIDQAQRDDLIIVYPGTYIGQIVLKHGVNIHCFPGVIINSASASGTLTDDNNPIEMSISGSPVIVNDLDASKRIVLLQSDSLIFDLHATLNINSHTLLHYQSTVFADTSINSLNIQLPLARKFIGKNFLIKKIDSSILPVTILPFSDEPILGNDHHNLSQQYASINLVSDGSAWF